MYGMSMNGYSVGGYPTVPQFPTANTNAGSSNNSNGSRVVRNSGSRGYRQFVGLYPYPSRPAGYGNARINTPVVKLPVFYSHLRDSGEIGQRLMGLEQHELERLKNEVGVINNSLPSGEGLEKLELTLKQNSPAEKLNLSYVSPDDLRDLQRRIDMAIFAKRQQAQAVRRQANKVQSQTQTNLATQNIGAPLTNNSTSYVTNGHVYGPRSIISNRSSRKQFNAFGFNTEKEIEAKNKRELAKGQLWLNPNWGES